MYCIGLSIALVLLVTVTSAYTNSQYGFSFDPPAGWIVDNSQKGVIIAFKDTNSASSINVNVNNTMGFGIDDVVSATKLELTRLGSEYNFQLVSEERTKVGDRDARVLVYDTVFKSVKVRQKISFLIDQDHWYVFTLTTPTASYDKYQSIFESSLNTLKFTSPPPTPTQKSSKPLSDPMEDTTAWLPFAGPGDVCTNALDTINVKSGSSSIKITCQFNNIERPDWGGIGRDLKQFDLTNQNGIGFWSYNPMVKTGHLRVYLFESLEPSIGYWAVARELDKAGWEYSNIPFSKFQPMTWEKQDLNGKMDLDKLMWMSIGIEDDYSYSSQQDIGTGDYVVLIDDVKSEATVPVVTTTQKSGIEPVYIISVVSVALVYFGAMMQKKRK
ncbi:MAG: PsbP-related protein [Methanoregula sp.]|nr:MAG: PsbP-related protein [Methanoregula sp.]